MICRCMYCGSLFIRFGADQRCPFCERPDIRAATREETARLYRQAEGGTVREKREDEQGGDR